jgi:inorganic pyrophosphatase
MSNPDTHITVFIENEAGSDIKHHYDEASLSIERTERVGAAYPFPYGFIPETLAPDGDAVDCFVLTSRRLPTGATVEALPIAIVEQTEAGLIDSNILAVLDDEPAPDLEGAVARIVTFVETFRTGDPEANPQAGRTLGSDEARAYIAAGAAAHHARLRSSES